MALSTEPGTGVPDRTRTVHSPDRRKRDRRRSDGLGPGGSSIVLEAALATLDKLNRGVLLIDAVGSVAFVNQAAHAMLARRDGLLLRRGRLRFESVEANTTLDRFLAGVDGPEDRQTLVLRVDGSPLLRSYRVLVSALDSRGERRPSATAPRYCVFVYEPNGGQRPVPAKVLQHLYGLTAAESRLVNHLFLGQSLSEAADAGRVTLNTAKSTLKRIFVKCAVGSQSELMLLLSLGPRTL